MFQRNQMDHSCTELWLVSVQPEGVRARPALGYGAAAHYRTQGTQHWQHRGWTDGP